MTDIFQQDKQLRQFVEDLFAEKIANAVTDSEAAAYAAERDEKLAEYTAKTGPILIEFSNLTSKFISRNASMTGVASYYAPEIGSFSEIINDDYYETRKKSLIDKFYSVQQFYSKSFNFVCETCHVTPVHEGSLYICPQCNGVVAESFVFTRKHDDELSDGHSKTRYKRRLRLNEVISKFMETSSSCVTYSQISKRVRDIMKAEKIPVSVDSIRQVLENEKVDPKTYDYTVIFKIIMQKKRSFIDDEDINNVIYIFNEINQVYDMACKEVKSYRVNFFSYHFFILQALERSNKARFAEYKHLIPSLRERDNFCAQKTIWNKALELLNWK